jgi:hypothetical protein
MLAKHNMNLTLWAETTKWSTCGDIDHANKNPFVVHSAMLIVIRNIQLDSRYRLHGCEQELSETNECSQADCYRPYNADQVLQRILLYKRHLGAKMVWALAREARLLVIDFCRIS